MELNGVPTVHVQPAFRARRRFYPDFTQGQGERENLRYGLDGERLAHLSGAQDAAIIHCDDNAELCGIDLRQRRDVARHDAAIGVRCHFSTDALEDSLQRWRINVGGNRSASDHASMRRRHWAIWHPPAPAPPM